MPSAAVGIAPRTLLARSYALRAQAPARHTVLNAGLQRRHLRSLAELGQPLQSQTAKAKLAQTQTPGSSTTIPPHPLAPKSDAPRSPKAAPPQRASIVLTIACPDQRGLVAAVSGWLAGRGLDIRDSAQYGDADTGRFFMRVHADAPDAVSPLDVDALRHDFEKDVGKQMQMEFEITDEKWKPRTMIMVSKIGHCLIDLIYRMSVGTLPIEVPLVVSNHPTFAKLCADYNVPFVHLPIDATHSKEWQEQRLQELCDEHRIDLVVLARYMQVLSPAFCAKMDGKIINIHHSFLPSFKGAKPYHQAHARGVKLIGATAHLVTADLDEGPLIAQDVVRVHHAHSAAQMVALGAEVEERVLASAVQWTAERRVLLNGTKTIVFN